MKNKELESKINKLEKELQEVKKQLKTNKKITLKEFWESKEKLVIHCDTEEKAKTLLSAFDKIGKEWWTNDKYTSKNYWKVYEEDTCYSNSFGYANKDFYTRQGATIYEFEDVDLTIQKEYQFTEDEKTILRNIDKKWKWIARDKNTNLWLFENSPYKNNDNHCWCCGMGGYCYLKMFNHLFQSIQWEDEEPVEIAKVIGK